MSLHHRSKKKAPAIRELRERGFYGLKMASRHSITNAIGPCAVLLYLSQSNHQPRQKRVLLPKGRQRFFFESDVYLADGH
jgi:hypothetical protein